MLIKSGEKPTRLRGYTVRAALWQADEGDEPAAVMGEVLLDGSVRLRLQFLEENWPHGQPVAQWESVRRLVYGSLRFDGCEPDAGTALLVEPLREAIEETYNERDANDE